MKRPSDQAIQLIIVILTALIAVGITVFALVTVNPADQFKKGTLVTVPLTTTHQPQRLIPYNTRTPITPLVTIVPSQGTPTFFPETPFFDSTMIPSLKMTEIHQLVITEQHNARILDLTAFVDATHIVGTLRAYKTRLADAPCSCEFNQLDCADFATHDDAQHCYTYCLRLGKGDIHQLDIDHDGTACESN